MGLSSIFQKVAAVAMNVAGDTKKPVTVYSGRSAAYDTATGETPDTWTHTTPPLLGLLYDSEEQKDHGDPKATKRTLLILEADLAAVPVSTDSEIDAEGYRWKVGGVSRDPAAATVIFYLYR